MDKLGRDGVERGSARNPEARLQRRLGFWALVAYGIGDILGAGIYALVGKVAGIAGTGAWISFAVAMGVASLTALSYAELGSRFPSSGGEASFCNKAFHRPALSFLVGWLVLASGVVSLATVAHAFTGYLLDVLPQVSAPISWFVPAGFLVALAGINLRGIRESSATNIVCTLVEASGLVIILVAGLSFVGTATPVAEIEPEVPATALWVMIAQGSALAFFAFIGFEDMVNVAEEVIHPERNLPRAILVALAVAGSVYVLVTWVATSVVPPQELAATNAPLLSVVRRCAPQVPASLFAVIALFAVANTGLLNFVMGSRLLYGMSRQRLLPPWFGTVHPRTCTPHHAILAVLVAALVLTFSGSLVYLAGTTSALLLTVFFTVNVSLLALRRNAEVDSAGFRVPIIVPWAAAVTCFVLVFFLPLRSLLSAGLVTLLGLVALAAASRKTASRKAGN